MAPVDATNYSASTVDEAFQWIDEDFVPLDLLFDVAHCLHVNGDDPLLALFCCLCLLLIIPRTNTISASSASLRRLLLEFSVVS